MLEFIPVWHAILQVLRLIQLRYMSMVSKRIPITVSTFPFFPVKPQILPFDFGDVPINSGEMTSATCSVSKGDLPLNITWIFNKQPINRIGGVTISLVNHRLSALSIESVQAEHAGNYTCIATNRAGTTSYSANLNVNGTLLF